MKKIIFNIGTLFLLCPFLFYAQVKFTNVTLEAGIEHNFEVFQGTFGGGLAVIDYNIDGFEDVFLAGGKGENILYKNNGDGTFTNVTEASGLLEAIGSIITQGAVSADVNRDGYPDLFITTIASISSDQEEFTSAANLFFINQGDGTFSNQTVRYGFSETLTFSTGAAFADFNKDGLPDLYVSNYFKDFNGKLDEFSGPLLGDTGGPSRDLLYINKDGILFEEVSLQYGMTHTGFGFQGVWTDFDNDNDLDLMVANDFGDKATTNLLYENNYPEQGFTEVGSSLDFDYGMNAMGIAVGDVNMDGWMDYFISNLRESPLLINQGSGNPFINKTKELKTSFSILTTNSGVGVSAISWGANFFDFDNDMDVDLYVNNGALNPGLPPNPNLLLQNEDGVFKNVGYISNTNDHSIGRGSVVFDYDNDGDMDLLVVNQSTYNNQQPPSFRAGSTKLYRNETTGNNWLKVKLDGEFSGTNGIGSRVEVFVDNKILIREIHAGSSHESQNSLIAHFGLREFEKVDSLKIKWSRGTQVIRDVNANQTLVVKEDIVVEELPKDIIVKKVEQIKVYPIPFKTNEINVKLPNNINVDENEIVYVSVTDLVGNKLYAVKVRRMDFFDNGYWIKIDHHLTEGIYMLIVEVGNTTYKRKLIGL